MRPHPDIPDHWSPQQALAVYALLDSLRERVWDQYRAQFQGQYRIDQQDQTHPDLFD